MGRRIETASPEKRLFLGPDPGGSGSHGGDGYLDRLIKYIPAEIIALYLGAANVVPQTDHNRLTALWIIAGLAAVCTPAYMYFTTHKNDAPTLWSQIIISSIAFPVWVYAIGGPFEATFSWYKDERWIGAIVIMFGTFLAGIYQPVEKAFKTPELPFVAK
jgi:hypothetical protein